MRIGLPIKILTLVWFFGWGFLILRFPVQCFRFLSWGRIPTPKQLSREKIVGYMGIGFGTLFLVELAFRVIR
jgi:hypothetical protein